MKKQLEKTDLSACLAAYCARTIRNAGHSAYRSARLRQDRVIPLSSLPDDMEQLAIHPKEIPAYFRAGRCNVSTPDSDLSDALRALPALRLEIVLRIFFLRQTESEAAAELGMSRDNVHYHKRQALKQLRKILGDDKE